MSVLRVLSQPQSYRLQFNPRNLEDPNWWLGDPDVSMRTLSDPRIDGWLGRQGVTSLARLCRNRIEEFYKQVAGPEHTPSYFVEKFLPYQVFPDLLSEIYGGARELILVRDFRDMLSSILAFNSKRGYQAFGRERMESDAEYVTSLMKPSAERLLRRWRGRGEGAHLVRYEDLVGDAPGTLAELLGYLGLEAGEDTVRDTIGRASGDEGSSMDHHRTISDPASSIGRWRDDLPTELADVCNEALGPILTEFGYEGAAEKVADSA